jgi:REP-associated tyrosine transposase
MLKLAQAALKRDRNRIYRASLERQAHDLCKAEQLLQGGLRAARFEPGELARLSGADARKVAIANMIWEQTVVSQKWLAERLGMRTAANVSQQLRRHGLNSKRSAIPALLRKWISSVKN